MVVDELFTEMVAEAKHKLAHPPTDIRSDIWVVRQEQQQFHFSNEPSWGKESKWMEFIVRALIEKPADKVRTSQLILPKHKQHEPALARQQLPRKSK
jgi:hypothetical protein